MYNFRLTVILSYSLVHVAWFPLFLLQSCSLAVSHSISLSPQLLYSFPLSLASEILLEGEEGGFLFNDSTC